MRLSQHQKIMECNIPVSYGNIDKVLQESNLITQTPDGLALAPVWGQVVDLIGRSDHGGTLKLSEAEEPVDGVLQELDGAISIAQEEVDVCSGQLDAFKAAEQGLEFVGLKIETNFHHAEAIVSAYLDSSENSPEPEAKVDLVTVSGEDIRLNDEGQGAVTACYREMCDALDIDWEVENDLYYGAFVHCEPKEVVASIIGGEPFTTVFSQKTDELMDWLHDLDVLKRLRTKLENELSRMRPTLEYAAGAMGMDFDEWKSIHETLGGENCQIGNRRQLEKVSEAKGLPISRIEELCYRRDQILDWIDNNYPY